jgi:hypothetical protein
MAEKRNTPPTETEKPRSGSRRLRADQYELKIRWDRARQVVEVSSSSVTFDFDQPLKVGARFPVSLTAPGVAISTTIEVTHCRLTVDPETGRYFRVTARFYPYVE